MRKLGLLVAILCLSALPARATHGIGCGGTAPDGFLCRKLFTAESRVYSMRLEGDFTGVVVVELINATTDDAIKAVCSSTCVFDGKFGTRFPGGDNMDLRAYAAGKDPWFVRALYVT